tara:strand:+ start:2163 stop:2360 length:198 start_codon:yes stop_codon:yes gene_type:complete
MVPMYEKHVDFEEVYLYKGETDSSGSDFLSPEAWEMLLNKLDIHEPATTVCLTVSHVKCWVEEDN